MCVCVWRLQFGVGQSKPEFAVDLRGGSVDWASKDKSSKKNVMEVGFRGLGLWAGQTAQALVGNNLNFTY